MIGGCTLFASTGDGNGLGSRAIACDGIVIEIVDARAGVSVDDSGDGNIGTVKIVVDSLLSDISLTITSGTFKFSVTVITESLQAIEFERGDRIERGDWFARGDWRGD